MPSPIVPDSPLTKTELECFWAKVDRRGSADCWEWKGSLHSDGYGRFGFGGQNACLVLKAYEE